MMNIWNNDLSLGIDISDRHISAVLLSRQQDKISVVKTVSQHLAASAFGPDGAKTARTIGRTLRQILGKAGIRQKQAWLSFGSPKLLLQMVDLPEQIPANLGQYIRRQIRNSTLLNSKNPYLDFSTMAKNESSACGQCFVAAIDAQPVDTVLKAMSVASVSPQAIDVPILSLCRAISKKQLSQGYKFMTLLFYQHGQDVYLAVLRKAGLDYIRHLERFPENETKTFETWASEQIHAVVQYYETESMTRGGEELSWQYIIASENRSDQMEDLKAGIEKTVGSNSIYLSEKTAADWLPLEKNPEIESLPLGATGAALRAWFGSGLKTEIDLLPEQNRKMRFVINYFTNTAKIAAAVLLVLSIAVYLLNLQAQSVFAQSTLGKKDGSSKNIEQILMDKQSLSQRLEWMNQQKKQMETIIDGYSIKSVSQMMEQIRQRIPSVICLTQLWITRDGSIGIEGSCPDMDRVQTFAGTLETIELVKSVSIRQSGLNPQNQNTRSFTIVCVLKEGS